MRFRLVPKSMTLDDLERQVMGDLVSCVLYTKAVARLPLP